MQPVLVTQTLPQQVLTGVPDAVLKRMRPDLLLFERLVKSVQVLAPSIWTVQSTAASQCTIEV